MKRTASEKKTSKSRGSSTKTARPRPIRITSPALRFVVCVRHGGYADLVPLKIYRVRRDPTALASGLLRVVDDSGEDYLYPTDFFRPIRAPAKLFQLVLEQASERT